MKEELTATTGNLFKQKTTYFCSTNSCDIQKIKDLQNKCTDSIIIVETSSSEYKQEITNQKNNCNVIMTVEKSINSNFVGLSMTCNVPVEKSAVLFTENGIYGLKYCEGL